MLLVAEESLNYAEAAEVLDAPINHVDPMKSERPRLTSRAHRIDMLLRWFAVFATPAALTGLFVWYAGWFSPRPTAQRIVDAFQATTSSHPGFRRNHAKGVCVIGRFDSNGQGSMLSRASVFKRGSYTVVGRLSIAGVDPEQEDSEGTVRSLALRIVLPRGEEWRLAMNSVPIFAVRTPKALLDQLNAEAPDPRTGRVNRAKMQTFLEEHPETRAFRAWLDRHQPSSRFDNATYFGISSFRTTNAHGVTHFVRWEMVPDKPYRPVRSQAELDPDFLAHGLMKQLANGALYWHLKLKVAMSGDVIDDSTQQWLDSPRREQVDAGTLVIDHALSQIDGPCRDISFDPLILPEGIAPSDDPLLAARSATYRVSFDRRIGEEALADTRGR